MFAHPFEDSLEGHGVVHLAEEFAGCLDDQGVEVEKIAEEIREEGIKAWEDLQELKCEKADARLFVREKGQQVALCGFGGLAEQEPDVTVGCFLFLGGKFPVVVEVAEFERTGEMMKECVRQALGRHVAQNKNDLAVERFARECKERDHLVEEGIGRRKGGWIFEIEAKDMFDGKGVRRRRRGGECILVGLFTQREQGQSCGHLSDVGFWDVEKTPCGFGEFGCVELLEKPQDTCAVVGLFSGDLITEVDRDLLERGIFFVLFEEGERGFGEVFVKAENEVHEVGPNALCQR